MILTVFVIIGISHGIILAAVIAAIRNDHLIEIFIAEAWLEKYLNA